MAVTAFVDVSVVPMDDERVLEHRTVLVRDGHIQSIVPAAEAAIPTDAERIDGRGRYLMPGLADMHVHYNDPRFTTLFLANGVTTVRNMWGNPAILAGRARIGAGETLGPTIVTCGPIMDGDPPVWNGSAVVATATDAARSAAAQRRAGYDFLKVYNRLTPEAYDAIIAEGRRHGMPVVGHVPQPVGLAHALAAGQASIEHLQGYLELLQADHSPLRGPDLDVAARFRLADYIDKGKLPATVARTREAGAWNCVTLVVYQKAVPAAEAEVLRGRPEMRYVPPAVRATWNPATDFRFKALTAEDFAAGRRADRLRARLTAALRDGGARLLLGTDTPNPFVVPGFSIHEELRNLVDAGLTPYEALRAGTRDAAAFLGALDTFGTVAEGRRADLILAEGNPLADVGNAARRAGVMVRGRWLAEATLRGMLEELTASYPGRSPRSAPAAPPAPSADGEPLVAARYELTVNDTPLGEHQLEVRAHADGTRTLSVQAAEEAMGGLATSATRLDLDRDGVARELHLERKGTAGVTGVTVTRRGTEVRLSGTPVGRPPVERKEEVPADALLAGSPLVACVLLGPELRVLAAGEALERTLLEVNPLDEAMLLLTALRLRRTPGVAGEDGRPRFLLEARRQNASFSGTVVVDDTGYPSQMDLEEQMGVRSFRRIP